MSSKEKSDHDPSWLDSENDDKIRADQGPLFGTGKLPVDDKKNESTKKPSKDELQEEGRAADYGSTSNTKAFKDQERDPLLANDAFPALNTKSAVEAKPHVPPQNPCLYLFHLLEGVSVVTALCLLATQILPLCFVKASSMVDRIGLLSLALKLYIALFCILFVITELNLPVPLVRSSPMLQTYASRGFLYSFLGLICVEEAYSERVKDIVSHGKDEFHIGWVSIFMQISSWLMLAVGLLYILLGVCCCKRIRDRMKEKEKQAWKEYREDLRKWKSEYGE